MEKWEEFFKDNDYSLSVVSQIYLDGVPHRTLHKTFTVEELYQAIKERLISEMLIQDSKWKVKE